MINTINQQRTSLGAVAVALIALSAPVQAVDFGAFGNIRYLSSNQDATPQGFMLGVFDLYAAHQIGDKTRAFVEYVMEGKGNEIVTDVERLFVARTFSDKFMLAAGRFHTPIGFWNNVYHHGALLQDTVDRPRFLDFEDGAGAILPTHTVGLMANGKFDAGHVSVGYDLAVGNGTSINTDHPTASRALEVNNSGDPNPSKAVALRLGIEPENSSVKLGVSTVFNHIPEAGKAQAQGVAYGGTLVAQRIFAVDVKLEMNKFDVLAEAYRFSNENKTGTAKKHSASAYFAQFGYRLTEDCKVVYRHENVSFEADDEYFKILQREKYRQNLLAVRMDVDDSNALKFEVDRQRNTISVDETRVVVQWEFLIP